MKPSNPHPPRLAYRLLNWFAGSANMEDILGDLAEAYSIDHTQNGKRKADLLYWKHVLSLIFSYALRKRKGNAAYSSYFSSNSFAMFANYFKIAIRNFAKQKLFTSLNIVGLALGMSVCLLALSIAVAIYKSDDFHERKDRIYQINTFVADDENTKTYASTFNALGTHLEDYYALVEEVVKIKTGFSPEINHRGNTMNFRGYFADASFFDVFSFEMVNGNPSSALAEPFSAVITQRVAETLYRNENPIGQILETDYGKFNITGVMKNLKQTHFWFEILTSYQTFEMIQQSDLENDWVNYRNNYVYAMLHEDAESNQLTDALAQINAKALGFNPDKEIKLESIVLDQAVPRWNISNAIGIGWDQPSMLFFFGIGLLVLLPAVFNYTNLSIARALKRGKEIGIRKVVGAHKWQIKAQFIVETIILSLIALAGSLIIFIPAKSEFLDMIIAAEVLDTSMGFIQITVFVLFAVLIGVLAGIFPAQFFSRLNPLHTIKGKTNNGSSNVSGVKKGLFIFQFFLSMVFIIGVGAILRQYSHVLNSNHGFESNNVLAVPFKGIDKQLVMNELQNHADVKAITSSSNLPGIPLSNRSLITSNSVDTIAVSEIFIGNDFVQNMEMKVAWGEVSSIRHSNQNEELVLVNEEFMRSIAVFNIQKDSLRFALEDGTRCRVSGIMKDINFEPLNESISPLIFRYSLEKSNYALLTINSPNIKKTINELDDIWHNIDQKSSFEANFLDDEISRAYRFLTIQIKIFSFLSAMAVTISCLGLLGMVAYTTENRTKEIAIRKIMGASNGSLYMLLTRDFVKLILVSAAIAIPFSYVFYDQLFLYMLIKYGTGLGVTEVVGSILFLFLVGFASIFWQTSKVAKANPAGNLRYE